MMEYLINFLAKHVWLRFIIAGGTAATVDLVILFILNKVFGLHYLLSAILAFICAFGVSFTLHKYWTFKSHEEETQKQVVMYFGTQIFSLCLNTLFMYIFVDIFRIDVMVSQFFVGGIVAFINFFVSRNIVFKYDRINTEIKV